MKKTKKVVVVGAGLWGKNLVRVFARLGVLKGVCDPNEQTLKEVLASLEKEGHVDGVRGFTWEEVLQARDVAAVVLAVPVCLHKEMTIAALESGKHVWVEKPMVVEVSAAEEIVAAAKLAGREVMVNHLMRYHAGVEKLLLMAASTGINSAGVDSVGLGRIWHVETVRKAPGRVFEDADSFYDLMPHDMSVVYALIRSLGAENGGGDITGFDGFGGTVSEKATGQKIEQFDWALAHLKCTGGLAVTLEVARLYPEKQQRIVVQATKGMLVFDDRRAWSEKLTYYSHEIKVESERGVVLSLGEGEFIPLVEREPLENAACHFIAVICGRADLRTPARDALEELVLMENIKQSMHKNL